MRELHGHDFDVCGECSNDTKDGQRGKSQPAPLSSLPTRCVPNI